MAASMSVPPRMLLSQNLQNSLPALYDAALTKLEISQTRDAVTGTAVVKEGSAPQTLLEVAVQEASAAGSTSVCFVVRRPGCVLCREHAQQLSELAAELAPKNVRFWGTVKEVGVDDEGLWEFHHTFFPFPLYRDVGLKLYSALGSRKIALTTWNPLRLWKDYKELGRRMTEKQIKGNLKGEGMIQGGILIFDATGKLRYALEEDIGNPLELADIRAAVNAVVNVEIKNEL